MMASFLALLSYYLIVISLQKINKTKNFLVAVQDLKVFGINLFLNKSNLSISLNFIYPKIKLAILMNIHYCVYVYFLQIGMSCTTFSMT